MKKSLLLSLILLSGFLLAACNNNSDENVVQNGEPTENVIETQDKNTTDDILENSTEENIVENQELTDIVDIEECKKAVQKYLNEADMEGNGEDVKTGDNITVDYIGRLEDGTVFDTSVESVAKVCGKYMEGRDYTEGLTFNAQGGQMIKGFDNGVIGMKIGQTKTVQFGPEEGYGEYDENLIVPVSLEELGDITGLSEGDRVNLGGYPVTIVKITDKEVIFDMNSELAGKNLIFDITLKSINK